MSFKFFKNMENNTSHLKIYKLGALPEIMGHQTFYLV